MAHWLQTSLPVLGRLEPVPEREERAYIRHGKETERHKAGLLPAMGDIPAACSHKAPISSQSQARRHSLRHATLPGECWLNTILCGAMGKRNNKDRKCLRESKD